MLRPFTIAALASICLFLSAPRVDAAVIYGFRGVTNNNVTNTGIGVLQLSVEVSNFGTSTAGLNQVLFNFKNVGPEDSTISEIYFEDGALLGISQVIQTHPVSFIGGSASPSNLPGGSSLDPAFNATSGFVAEAANPAPHKGVNPGQQVGIVFELLSGLAFSDVISSLDLALTNPGAISADPKEALTLRIGIHVINFANGGSESFINGPSNGGGGGGSGGGGGGIGQVPEPSSLAIFGALFGAAGIYRRRNVVATN